MATLSKFMGIGGVTSSTAKYRARASAAATLSLEYSVNSDLSSSTTTAGVSVVSGDDFCGGETISGLSTRTKYYYSVKIDGVRAHSSPFPSFRTFPAAGRDANIKLIFGSCRLNGAETTIFPSVAAEDPDLVIDLGDFGYPDATDLATQRSNYQNQFGAAAWDTSIIKACPWAHVWDDHDYGGNNVDGDLSGKATSLQVFKEYIPTYDLVNGSNGIWQLIQIANVDIYMLDTRYQREGVPERFPASSTKIADTGSSGASLVLRSADSPSAVDDAYNTWYAAVTVSGTTYYRRITDYVASTRTVTLSASVTGLSSTSTYFLRRASMLDMDGIASSQLDWLIDGLNNSTAKLKILCTSVLWNKTGTLATDTWGGWDADQVERKYIQQQVTASRVIVISGDSHKSGIDDGTNSIWPEISSSPWNKGNDPIRGTWSHGTTNSGHFYGVIDVTDTSVTLTIKNADGTVPAEVTPLTIALPSSHIPWLRAA